MTALVVCLDGTNQQKLQPSPTNIARLFDSLGGAATDAGEGSFEASLSAGGRGKYLPGVGSLGDPVLRVLGNVFGDGIAEPIIRGYTFLSRNYSGEEDLFIVGFSRGATAARALAGLVVGEGLLNPAAYDPSDKTAAYARAVAAWYQYRLPTPDLAQQARLAVISGTIGQPVPRLGEGDLTAPPPIRAVGVFDTVSSLGAPHLDSDGEARYDFSICNTDLSPRVANGFHALAADEMRDLFTPTFWAARDGVVQHIFPGSHSNVGGGYPERGLSDGALAWMLASLAAVGLPCDAARVQPAIAPRPLEFARDDGATFPFNLTPRRPRAFPVCAEVDAFLRRRLNQPCESLPRSVVAPYQPAGRYADGSALA